MLISNPLGNPLFAPTAILLAVLLGASFLALLVLHRFNLAKLGGNVLFERWKVWAIIAPVYALALFLGAGTVLILVTLLVVQGLREYIQLVGLPAGYGVVLMASGLVAAPAALLSPDAFHLLVPLLFIVATLQPLLLGSDGLSVRHLAFAILGWGYIPFFLGHIVLIYRYAHGGLGILLALGMATALSDIGAFMVGKRFGRSKLAPRISPNKTREGVLGNLLGAYIGVGLLAYALPESIRILLLVALPPVIAAGALWGDLLESSIKREFQQKDAGGWLPGFGGLLDRVDSLILVVPLTFYFLRLVGS